MELDTLHTICSNDITIYKIAELIDVYYEISKLVSPASLIECQFYWEFALKRINWAAGL